MFEKVMKIDICKKEYRLLVEMLYLSDWMMHSHSIDEKKRHHEHEKLRNKLLSYYKEMGAEDIVNQGKESEEYYETNAFDDAIHEKFITPYDEETFWGELIGRLAMRDVIKEIGKEKLQSTEEVEIIMRIEEVKEKYANEFKKHSLENVRVISVTYVKNTI